MRAKYLRVLVLCMVLMLVISTFSATFAENPDSPKILSRQDDGLRIAQFVDSGSSLQDGGFNESARAGLRVVEERFGAEVVTFQTADPENREADLRSLAEEGFDIILTVGFNLAEVTATVAQDFPDVHFIGVDQFQVEPTDNVTGLIFPEDQSGFLAGVLAVSLTQTDVVGGVFGTEEAPPVVAFKEGFEAGVEWASEQLGREVAVIGTYHPGTVFDAFSDPDWGATTAATTMSQGADVIFAAAGGTGVGALEEVAFEANASDAPIYCIGVDSDQWLTVETAHPCLVSSATKIIDGGVVELTEAFLNGTIEGGNYVGDVALAPFHDFEDAVDSETRALLQRAELGVRTGAILTCYLLDLSGIRIGLVMDNVVDDATFNESAWNGLHATENCGAEIASVESLSPEDYTANITQFAEDGYNIIVTVGFTMEEATLEAAAEYPDIRFIGIDQVQAEPTPGVTGLIFQEDHSGFLAGWLAARMSQSGTIAAILASEEAPPVVAFSEGFRAGALRANPMINIISTYHPGGVDESFNDPDWGVTTAREALDQGADVVFAAAGNTGNGALLEVAEAAEDGNPLFCIGVDTDQWFTLPEARSCLVSSAVKIIDGGLTTLIIQYHNGIIEDGNFVGIVGLAPYHDFEDVVPSTVKAELDRLATNLASGSVSTGVSSPE